MKSERLTETSGKNLCRTKEYYPSLTASFAIEERQRLQTTIQATIGFQDFWVKMRLFWQTNIWKNWRAILQLCFKQKGCIYVEEMLVNDTLQTAAR